MTDIISPLPYTFSNGSVADATQVNANFAQIVSDVNTNASSGAYRGAAVFKSNRVDLTEGEYNTLSFNSAYIDTDSIFDVGTYPTRLTVPSGVSLIRLSFSVSIGSGDFDGFVSVFKNGSPFTSLVANFSSFSTGNNSVSSSLTGFPLSVSAGNYFELKPYVVSGSDPKRIAARGSFFEMQILG